MVVEKFFDIDSSGHDTIAFLTGRLPHKVMAAWEEHEELKEHTRGFEGTDTYSIWIAHKAM